VSLLLLLLGGCCYPVREYADQAVCELAARPLDLEPAPPPDQSAARGPGQPKAQPPKGLPGRLEIPPELPGAGAPPIDLPDKTKPEERKQAIQRLYRPLPEVVPLPEPAPGPGGRPLTLADLQRLALSNSPLIRQAAADVEAAKGAAIQAGAYPNPTAGYEADQVGSSGTPGQQGGFVEQIIKTGGKLKLAQAAATMDLFNAQLAFRRAQKDLATQVRAGYFNVLVAQETLRVARALDRYTDVVYRVQVDQAVETLAAPYEPLQLRVLAVQARAAQVQALNGYTASWKQLAATLGLPALPPTQLAGRVDVPIPVYHWDQALARVLSTHTDVATAKNTVQRARYNLRLAEITPVPDVDLRVSVQKDYTGSPVLTQVGVQVGVPVPIWDRNKGGIIQAQGTLLRAVEEEHRVRDDLTSRLAEAFQRYESNRTLLRYYRDQILPDQVRAVRAIYLRHNEEPDRVSFGDIVTAQQTLVTTITTYVTTLGALWTAVVDVANLLQTDDLFQIGEEEAVAPVPDLEHLLPPPCCHPCTPLPDPHLKQADPNWPPAVPDAEERGLPAAEEKRKRGNEQGDTSQQVQGSRGAPWPRTPGLLLP
jgi:cobalt-zinc-cadmium efflux system outer membrane protein